jgi:capsular exopolysaccharide synthesis family protein
MKDTHFDNITSSENELEKGIDFKAEFFKLLLHWKFFAITVFISLCCAFIYLRYTNPVFNVSCKVLIKDDSKSRAGKNAFISELDLFAQQSNLQNEIGIISSKTLSRKTVKELGFYISYYTISSKLGRNIEIYNQCPFKVVIDTSHVQLLNVKVNMKFYTASTFHITISNFAGATAYSYSKEKNISIPNSKNILVDTDLKIGDQFTNENFSFKIESNPNYVSGIEEDRDYYFIMSDPLLVGENLAASIETNKIDKDASIVEISLKSTLPEKSVDFLNALSKNYINLSLENKNLTAIKTISFIDSQLNEINDSLHNVEDILQNFRTKNQTMDLSAEYQAILTKLEAQDNEKVTTNIEIKYYEYILDYLKTNSEYNDIVSPSFVGVTDASLNTLVTELMTLATEKNKLSISSTEKNPYYTTLETNIASTKKALLDQVKNSLGLAQITLKDINKRISESEVAIDKLPKTERDLLTIKRKYDVNDATYSFLLEKKADASIAKASNLSDNLIVDPAEIGLKVYPKKMTIYLIALLIGLIIPFLVIKFREYLNDSIHSKEEIESHSSLPIIGTIAHSKYATSLIVIDNPRSMVSETIRSVKANMDFLSAANSKIITLTSTVSGEGKTFCAINLASAFAISEMRTLLIGADLRRPKIIKDFNLTNDRGLTSYLIGKCSLTDIINETSVKNLHIITAGPVPPNPAELLSSEKMKALLNELRLKYDYIIIDTPPLGVVTDALFLMKYADINIYVTRFNFTSKKVIKDVNDLVKTTGVKNVCFLLNDVLFKKTRYGKYGRYSDKYGYAYTYSEGYYED